MFSNELHFSRKRMSALRKTTTNISKYLRQTKDANEKSEVYRKENSVVE